MLLICDKCGIGLPADETECPMCKLKADLATTEQKLMDANIKWAVEVKKVCAELVEAKKDYATALRREKSVYNQKTRNYKKLKTAEAGLAAAKEELKEEKHNLQYCKARFEEVQDDKGVLIKYVEDAETGNKRLKEAYKDLNDIVQINCNPPDDCNDPKVLKISMKACFEQAQKREQDE